MATPCSSALLTQCDFDAYADTYAKNGYVDFGGLIAPEYFRRLQSVVARVLDQTGIRRDVTMPTTGHSPRAYTLSGQTQLSAGDPLIDATYRDPDLRAGLAAITGDAIVDVPYEPERFVAARYDHAGDTHGWHWDDYAYALVWVFATPAPAHGGTLEYVRNVPWNKAAPAVEHYLSTSQIETRTPAAGAVYLLRTDTTLHRITPLQIAARREIICFSYASAADVRRQVTHETIEVLAG